MPYKKSADIQKSAEKLLNLSSLAQHNEIFIPDELIAGKEDYESECDAIVKPHWDDLVEMLDEGKYRDVLSLLKRLKKKQNKFEKQRDETQKTFLQYQMLLNLLRLEVEASSLDTTIGSALGLNEPKTNYPKLWSWKVRQGASGNRSGKTDDLYNFIPEPTDHFKASYPASKLPNHPLPLKGGETWEEAIDRVSRIDRLKSTQLERISRRLKVVRFRISVIKAVLSEYEITGHVSHYATSKRIDWASHRLLDVDLVLFIRTGVNLFEEKPDSFPNRDALINGVLQELEWGRKDSRRMREKLDSTNLYNNQGKPGRTRKLKELPLLTEMVDIWKDFLEKGEKAQKGDL